MFIVLTQLTFRHRCDDRVEGYCPDCGRPLSFIPQGRMNYVCRFRLMNNNSEFCNSNIVSYPLAILEAGPVFTSSEIGAQSSTRLELVRPAFISSRSSNPDNHLQLQTSSHDSGHNNCRALTDCKLTKYNPSFPSPFISIVAIIKEHSDKIYSR